MTPPMSLGGALAGYPAALAQQFEAAKDRNEIWSIGLREGIFKPNDTESLAKFKAISQQLEKESPTSDAFFTWMPGPWSAAQVPDDIRRMRRGEQGVLPQFRAFRWMTGQ